MQKFIMFSFLLTGILINTALSLPRFAVRLGDKCIDCHYNPTGGIIRNEDGWNFGKNIMSAITPRDQNFLTTPKIGDNITFGLDYRTQFLYSSDTSKTPFLKRFFTKQELSRAGPVNTIKAEGHSAGRHAVRLPGEFKNRALWFKGFEQTYLERDVRELTQIGNIISFRNLLHLTAMRTGQLISPSQLGRDAKLNAVTTSRYLSLLEASFIIQRVSPYLKNRANRLIKSPKLYVSDSGLACYLAGIESGRSSLLRERLLKRMLRRIF